MSAFDFTKDRRWFPGLILIAAVILAYQPAWRAGFIWDDDVYVTQNRLLTAPDGLKRIWFSLDSPSQYFPLVYTNFRIEHSIWGNNPAGYHWVNILLHAVNALLVWRLLQRMNIPGAWLGAAIFALHPVQVESVAWITERKNILSLLFYLSALLAWIEFVENKPVRWKYYALAVFFYALALFAKTTACTLPAALALVLWYRQKPLNLPRWLQIAPFVFMGFAMGNVSIWWEHHHQGTVGAAFNLPLTERFIIAGHAFWFDLWKLVWPVNLIFIYPHWNPDSSSPLAYGWLVAALLFGGVIIAGRNRGVATAYAFYAAALLPTLGFFMMYAFRYSYVADHYQYAACIGPFALAAALLFQFKGLLVRSISSAIVLTLLGALTWNHCRQYANSETLWRATLARNPSSSIAHNDLSHVLLDDGRIDEAIIHCHEVLAANPDDPVANGNLAFALLKQGLVDEAILHCEKSLAAQPYDPMTHYTLAGAFFKRGQWDRAERSFRRAIELKPDYAEAFCNLGYVVLQQGRTNEAASDLREAIRIRPDYALPHNDLGHILLETGLPDEAADEFNRALDANPNFAEAHFNLGGILLRRGQTNQALAHFRKAVEIRPDLARALPKGIQ